MLDLLNYLYSNSKFYLIKKIILINLSIKLSKTYKKNSFKKLIEFFKKILEIETVFYLQKNHKN